MKNIPTDFHESTNPCSKVVDSLMKLVKTGHSVRARGKIRATLHEMEEKSGDDVIM